MEDLKDVVSLLLQLFPGFIAAWILYGFSSYPKPSQFERLAQALVFSFFVKVLLIPERAFLFWVGTSDRLGFRTTTRNCWLRHLQVLPSDSVARISPATISCIPGREYWD